MLVTGSITSNGNYLSPTGQIRLYNVANNNWTQIDSPKLSGDAAIDFRLSTRLGTFYISDTGNVGIGYTSPTVALQVSGTIAVGNATTTGWGRFLYDTATNQVRIQASKDGTDSIGLSFYTQASGGGFAERMIISGSNVGIGTSSPLNVLDVRQTSAAMGNYQTIQAFSTDSAAINLGGGISLGGYFTGTTSIAQFGSIVGRKENGTSGNYDGYLAFGTNAQATGVVERMRITSNGIINTGGVTHQYFAGSVAGNASLTLTVNCESMSSFRITCVMNHFGYITSYGCANMSLLSNGPVITVITISDTTSPNGGSWSYAKVSNTQFTITKNAGTYSGGGNYFVEGVGTNSY